MREMLMNPVLPPVSQSPDDLMELPIAELVRKLDQRVRRAVRWVNLARTEADPTRLQSVRNYLQRETELLHAAATALRARAQEGSRYAASIGIDCPPVFLRKAPQMAACAFMKQLLGPEYGRDE